LATVDDPGNPTILSTVDAMIVDSLCTGTTNVMRLVSADSTDTTLQGS
jgi:hypothetical protein